MRDTQRRTYEMLARVRDYGAANAADFPAGSRGRELFDELNGVVGELEGHAEAQVSTHGAAAEGTTGRKAARASLREQLEAVRRTAQALEDDAPGLTDRFRLPRGNNDQALLSTARAFHAAATPLKAGFVRHEMPADFLAELQRSIDLFEQSITGQNNSRASRAAATSAIESAVERGTSAVRKLEAVVLNKYRADPARLAAWETASHTARTPRRASKQTETPQPPN